MRDHVLAYIRARLDDPRLSRSTIAAAHHMSPRTLDRLFGGQPWSVRDWIDAREREYLTVYRDVLGFAYLVLAH
jgi:hypothetical protein